MTEEERKMLEQALANSEKTQEHVDKISDWLFVEQVAGQKPRSVQLDYMMEASRTTRALVKGASWLVGGFGALFGLFIAIAEFISRFKPPPPQ